MKKYAIITFDYEVFLGRDTGTIENCVIRPTREILKILKENNAKSIFFVDATWLLFIKENFYSDFQQIAIQLKEIIASGSSVELHLHPQWIRACKTDNKIAFNSFEHYRLHSLDNEEILTVFKKSVEILENITDQKIHCFRAGGWCIEPFIRIKEAFEKVNIKYDFSVVAGASVNDRKIYDYDFTRAPQLQFYNFNSDICEHEPSGRFIEFPLCTYNSNALFRIVNKALLIIKNDKMYGDGIGFKEKNTKITITRLFSFSKNMLSLDKTHNIIFRYLLSFYFRRKDLIVVVSHPKTSSAQTLINLGLVTRKFTTLNGNDLDSWLLKYTS